MRDPRRFPGAGFRGSCDLGVSLALHVQPSAPWKACLCPAPTGAKVWAVLGRVQAGWAAQVLGVGASLGAQERIP